MIKPILTIAIALFAATISVATETAISVHGMVLFSDGESVYASHLAMKHHPHNYQGVFTIKAANQAHFAQWVRRQERVTLAPERFDLLRIPPTHTNPLSQFKGDVYVGHFERDGKHHSSDVFRIEKIWMFEKLEHGPSQALLRVGDNKPYFLTPKLTLSSDRDLFFEMNDAEGKTKPLAMAPPLQMELPKPIYIETEDFK